MQEKQSDRKAGYQGRQAGCCAASVHCHQQAAAAMPHPPLAAAVEIGSSHDGIYADGLAPPKVDHDFISIKHRVALAPRAERGCRRVGPCLSGCHSFRPRHLRALWAGGCFAVALARRAGGRLGRGGIRVHPTLGGAQPQCRRFVCTCAAGQLHLAQQCAPAALHGSDVQQHAQAGGSVGPQADVHLRAGAPRSAAAPGGWRRRAGAAVTPAHSSIARDASSAGICNAQSHQLLAHLGARVAI